MPVDPELQPIVEALNAAPPLADVPLQLLRQGSPIPMGTPAQMARVTNRKIVTADGDLPIRIYHPREPAVGESGVLPVLVYFHGGGFVLGNIDSHDVVVRALAKVADCIVVSVDYRLAPEHRFPAALNDCLSAVRWVHEHAAALGADAARIAVGGDSAGGNLATVVALQLRDESAPKLAAQMLIYPVTRLNCPAEGSMVRNGQGYFLTAEAMAWFEQQYLGALSDAEDPDASPLLARDLSHLPPAFVLTAEFDPLHDQGQAYAKRLSEAGVPCTYTCYDGAIHGFFGMPAAIGQRAVVEAGEWLKGILAAR